MSLGQGGNYGTSNAPIGKRGQMNPYRTSGTNNNALFTTLSAKATVTGQSYLSVCNAGPQTVTVWSGNASYAPSHVVITCLGKAL